MVEHIVLFATMPCIPSLKSGGCSCLPAHPLHQEAKTHFSHLLGSRLAADYEV